MISKFVPAASVLATVMLLLSITVPNQAQLSSAFYDASCPNALSTIRTSIRNSIARERRMAASLIRLHFHDCFVSGCDASILLKGTSSIESEQDALPNKGSARGFEVVEKAKTEVEKICPGIVSCADILTIAARDASEYVGGPKWTVKLGRRDSTAAFKSAADGGELPGFKDSLNQLSALFQKKGLNQRDLVALSGAHTIGQAQCFLFRDRLYDNSSDIDAGFATTRRRRCPSISSGNGGDGNLAPLDLVTPNSFDNNYYKNLMQKEGLLVTDQVLFGTGESTDGIVSEYSRNPSKFAADFAAGMIKMADIEPLVGSEGEIRRICSAPN